VTSDLKSEIELSLLRTHNKLKYQGDRQRLETKSQRRPQKVCDREPNRLRKCHRGNILTSAHCNLMMLYRPTCHIGHFADFLLRKCHSGKKLTIAH